MESTTYPSHLTWLNPVSRPCPTPTLASVPTTRSLSSTILSLMEERYRFSMALWAVRFSPRPCARTGFPLATSRLMGSLSASTTSGTVARMVPLLTRVCRASRYLHQRQARVLGLVPPKLPVPCCVSPSVPAFPLPMSLQPAPAPQYPCPGLYFLQSLVMPPPNTSLQPLPSITIRCCSEANTKGHPGLAAAEAAEDPGIPARGGLAVGAALDCDQPGSVNPSSGLSLCHRGCSSALPCTQGLGLCS